MTGASRVNDKKSLKTEVSPGMPFLVWIIIIIILYIHPQLFYLLLNASFSVQSLTTLVL